MSDSPTHYSLLAEHHHDASHAAHKLKAALTKRDEAEKEIREARRTIAACQSLIDGWYRENPEAGSDD